MSYSSSIQTSFSGPSTTSTSPPHSGLAVGSNYVVMIDGSRIEWTNLTGGSPVLQSVYGFFSPLSPTGGLYDQRVIYDSVNQRFVVIMQYLAPGGTATNIDIAVSKDSNPNDGWYFSQLNTTVTIGGQTTGSDRPMLATDGSNVYITAPQYNLSASGYAGTENWIIGDTAGAGGGIYGGGTLSVTASEVMPSTQGIFAVASGNGKTYYASDYSSGGQIVVALQTYDKATNTFSTTSTIALGNIDQGGTYTAQQQGTTLLLDAGDKRIASMVYANGYLYAVAEMKPTGSSVPLVHWFKIDVSNPTSPSLVAQGDISGAAIGTSVATFNPSIAVDAAGDVIINFTASGPNMYPADYYVFQGGGDPVGSFSAPVLYQASTGFFNAGDGASVQRWGAYSTATVDPNNPNSFWISNEYVASGWWQTAVAQIAIQNSASGPTVSSIAASGTGITSGAGNLNAGQFVTLTVNFSAAVTVNTSGGTPTITLNDGGTASYTGGSGSNALTFSYTVAAGQNTADLIVSALNLNGATIADGSGNAANLSGATNYNPAGVLQIDTTAPTIASIVASGAAISNGGGNLSTGQVVTLTVNLSEAVTVNTSGGTPTLTLNDGGTASYTGGSGSTALTFSYTVAAGQNTADLIVSALNLNGGIINDGAGNAANLSGTVNYNPAGTLQIDTTSPTIASIAATGTGITNGTGSVSTGAVVTLTVNLSEAVTVNTTGGTPTLTLNDGGTASYTGGSGSTALTFSYTVAAGQNTADLIVSTLNLNGGIINDGAGNPANLSGAVNYNPAGTLQIDTTSPTIASIAATGTGITNGTGSVSTGQVVTLTVNLSKAVTVNTTGGTPTLTLNDGGTASYTGGSGSAALTFSYTVAAGQNTADLIVSALNLNGAAINDGAGNAANLSGAVNYNPAGTLQIDTTAPTIASIAATGTGITNGTGSVSTGAVVTLTVNLSEAVTVNTTGGTPTLTLNDGGTASYTGGSGSAALTFSYTVAAGQNTADLIVSALNLNGAAINDGAGNAANLSGAVNYNPAGTLQIDTTSPTIASIAATGTGITNGTGSVSTGAVVTLTVNLSEAVTVNTTGGTPTLTLNDGGTASYTGGSGSAALTFSYTVAAGQNTADLIVSALSLNGAIINDGAGNAANLSGAVNYNPAGTLQIDTTAPTIASIAATGTGITNGSGSVSTGQVVTLTVNLSEAVTVNTTGGTPTLTLNDGGTASYTGGSGSAALTFSYTVAAGQTTSDLAISALNLNGAVISDGAGNAANLSGATNYNPTGTLQVNVTTSSTSSIQTLFAGPSNTSSYPPHNGLAVGPNYVVMIEGSRIEWTNLTGGSPTLKSVYSFFSPLSPTGGLYDQRIAYDSVNQRFVVIMQYLAPGGTATAIDIAVSKDSNPNDGWTFSQLNTTVTINGQSTGSDRPMLAVDGSNVYITAPQYGLSASAYAGTENWIIGDTAGAGGGIYGGGTLSLTASEIMPSTQGIFAVASGNNGKTYYASDFSSGGQIVVALQTYDKATNTFSTTSTVALGNIDQGGSYTVQQQGTSLLLDAVDNRIASMVYANGYLYAVAVMKPSGSSVPLVHWFKIDVSNPGAPALAAQGDISGASLGTNVATFDPSIAVDAAGDVIINFTASGPNMYPSDYYVFQAGGGAVGSFSAPILYQASTGFFNSGDGNSTQRWGLNSSATVDPNNPNSFWISNEYVASGWWQTAVAQISIQNSTSTGPTIASIAASGAGITNGAGNLNAGKLVTLTVNFSAAVTVNTSGGTPTLTLNDGGTASYTGGSGGTALTFSYTVAAGQNTPDLVISALNLNGASITDGSGNAAYLSGASNSNPAGVLQIDTTAPTIASIVASGSGITNGGGSVSTGQVVTLTVNLSEAVTVNTTGGAPTLTLNDGATANYTGGSGSTALTFSYTVAAGQTTSDLAISALNLNGALISDSAGNAATLSGATNYNPAGILQVNPTSGVPQYSHIVVVVEENKDDDEITGNTTEAPYINSLMAGGALLTSFFAETHPSQSNYYALYAGSTFGFSDDDPHSLPDPTLYTVLQGAGLTFRGYVDQTAGGSDPNHDPWISFPEARTVQTSFSTTFPALFPNGNYSSLPTVSFVIPSIGNDMHDGTIQQGDTWLQQNLDAYAQWALANNSLLIVTWDENDNDKAPNQIPTLLYGANVVPGNYDTTYNHYNLLSTILASYGLTGPNQAATAAPIQVFGNPAAGSAPRIVSMVVSGTGITNASGDLNAGKLVTLTLNFSAAVTVNTSGGTPMLALNDGGTATYVGGSGGTALTFNYVVAAGQNTADLVVSSFNLNGAAITDGGGNAANLSGATNYNPAGTLQIDTTAPTIAINTIAGNDIVNATEASAGFTLSGTTTDAEHAQAVTVNILNSASVIVNSYTSAVSSSNTWSVAVTSAQALALADGKYTVTANVSDAAGNAAPTATRALTIDEDKGPEIPTLTISSTSLTVNAGGSVALGITATPVDADDQLSLKISGLPSYESITAPAGNTVTSSLQSDGTYTWTITEGASTTGQPLTGLTLSSSYTGTDHPVATFTVTASNTTTGETGTSAAQTMTVIDPPVDSSGGGAVSSLAGPGIGWPQGHIDRLAALMDQFAAAGFRGGPSGPIPSAFQPQPGPENQFLAAPHFHS
ncbi:alkaline phosphatase family protein [Bradyrhizobium sp. CIAT3101]|uniref:alkaline phosphatase family protein n=1 Tax=Bradyrhizobium sp. CIAT3101 TaxID=439387 RepID=UPI0024B08AB4|nr:alkaline phosphatase family protein [Bradyrhizobium sp. CIAT3101]WFU78283.1 alkaline phosphatase family protein [Bradyrhizobium sp. CIAT3101]